MNIKHLIVPNRNKLSLTLEKGLNPLSGEQLNELMFNTNLSTIMSEDSSFSIKVGLVVRSTHTNEVLVWDKDSSEILYTRSVTEDPRGLQGHFLVLSNAQTIMQDNISDLPIDCIKTSVIYPVGVIRERNSLIIVFQLIITDNFVDSINFSNGLLVEDKLPIFRNIKDLKNFTNPTPWTKMILPTLKIVGGNNNESKDSGETRL